MQGKINFLRGKGYFLPFLLFFILFAGFAGEVKAAGVQIFEVYDPYNLVTKSAYYVDNGTYDSYNFDISGTRAVSVTYTSYTDDTFTVDAATKTYTAAQYGWQYFNGMGFNCNVPYIGELHDSNGELLVRVKMLVEGLQKPLCNSEPDGSMGEGKCDICGIFDCPGWSDFMGGLDDIKNAIPPPPDWHEVSQIFSDAIVPRLVDETRVMLDDLLGRAPEPPTPPPSLPTMPDLPDHDDGGFQDKEPEMQDSGVEGFDAADIKDDAPEIQYEEDPTGGFDLSVDPVDALPDVVPGGDPGEYKRDPEMMPAEYPGAPKESGEDVGKPTTPKDDGATPPIPGDSGSMPPIPGDDVGGPSGYMSKPKGG